MLREAEKGKIFNCGVGGRASTRAEIFWRRKNRERKKFFEKKLARKKKILKKIEAVREF
jgi:hypothetical protein